MSKEIEMFLIGFPCFVILTILFFYFLAKALDETINRNNET